MTQEGGDLGQKATTIRSAIVIKRETLVKKPHDDAFTSIIVVNLYSQMYKFRFFSLSET